jgi:micrococcal nuclease
MAPSRAVVVAVLAATLAGAVRVAGQPVPRPAADRSVRVVEVIDGDTIVVRDRRGRDTTVRMLGVDTPETKHPTKGVECFGPEASAYTHARLAGRAVRLRTDTEHHDHYGRLLATVVVDGRSFSRELLAQGYARFLVIAPNTRDGHELLLTELAARRAERGLWGAC